VNLAVLCQARFLDFSLDSLQATAAASMESVGGDQMMNPVHLFISREEALPQPCVERGWTVLQQRTNWRSTVEHFHKESPDAVPYYALFLLACFIEFRW